MVEFSDLSDAQRIERFEQFARRALREYGVEDAVLTHRTYTENVIFEVADVAAGLHGALRICRPDWEKAGLESEILWLAALARDTGLRILAPIRTQTDEPFCTIEMDGVPEPRHCVLFTWVEGAYAARRS